MAPTLPLDFNPIRKALVNEITRVTGVICILEEQKGQTSQKNSRPPLPYFSFKIITPAAKNGDDAFTYTGSGTKFNLGGQRRMTVSFHVYTVEPEDAYNNMMLWQSSLERRDVQENLRRAGISVQNIGNVADNAQLLNTGYEARAQMDTTFGIASNLTEDLSEIQTSEISGTASTPNANLPVGPFDAP